MKIRKKFQWFILTVVVTMFVILIPVAPTLSLTGSVSIII
jgi:hypothetical protein